MARIFNTYGPRMHPNDGRVVSNFIVQALQRRADITIYGDGSQTRSFCYVDDLIEGLMRLMATADDVTGPVNLGNPGEFTIRELAETVHRADRLALARSIARPLPLDDPRQRCPDISTGADPARLAAQGAPRRRPQGNRRLLQTPPQVAAQDRRCDRAACASSHAVVRSPTAERASMWSRVTREGEAQRTWHSEHRRFFWRPGPY